MSEKKRLEAEYRKTIITPATIQKALMDAPRRPQRSGHLLQRGVSAPAQQPWEPIWLAVPAARTSTPCLGLSGMKSQTP